jgi:hypothetical protein
MAIFTFNNPSGSSYFTVETVRNNQGFYDSSSLKNGEGFYSNFNRVSASHLVTSSYIFAEVIPQGTSSFEFNPLVSGMPTGSFYFRGTGNFTVNVATYSGSYTLTPAQLYGQGILNTFALTPIPDFQSRVAVSGGYYQDIESQNTILNDIGTDLLRSASLVVTPNAYKENFLYSVIPSNGSGDFTFTRATTATRVNSAGLVELVPYNLVEYSEQFDNAEWTKQQSSITTNVTTAPNGTLTADKLVEDTSNATHRMFNNIAFTVSTTIATTYSFYLKSAGRTRAWVRDNDVVGALFNLANGTIVSIEGTATATIASVGDGWYRCTITRVNSNINGRLIVYLDNGTSDSYLGDGTSGVFVWGGQAVEGTNPLTYLPTTTRLNIPRVDYSLGSANLLLEPQRTNLATYSQEFDNVVWTKTTGTSVIVNTSISPSGVQNADTIVGATGPDVFGGPNTLVRGISGLSSSTSYVFTVYLKGSGSVTLTCRDGGTGFTNNVVCNLTSSWQRFEISRTTAVASTAFAYIFSNASGNFDAWGAQLEVGSYATSYIPTTSASVTRNEDQISKTGISSLIGQSEGTVFIDITINSVANTDLILVGNSTGAVYDIYMFTGGNKIIAAIVNNGSYVWSQGATFDFVVGVKYKCAIGYKSGSIVFYINGIQIGSSSSTFVPFAIANKVQLAEYLYSGKQSVSFQSVSIFTTRLTNDQLAQLTTI